MGSPFGAVERPRACRVCGVTKAASQFYMVHKRTCSYRRGMCRTCWNTYQAANKRQHKAQRAAYVRERYASDPVFRAREIVRKRAAYRRERAVQLLDGVKSRKALRYAADPEFRARELARKAAWDRQRRESGEKAA